MTGNTENLRLPYRLRRPFRSVGACTSRFRERTSRSVHAPSATASQLRPGVREGGEAARSARCNLATRHSREVVG